MVTLELEQLVAGALLFGFDTLSSTTLIVLIKDFLAKNKYYDIKGISRFNTSISRIEYIQSKNGYIPIRNNLNLKE